MNLTGAFRPASTGTATVVGRCIALLLTLMVVAIGSRPIAWAHALLVRSEPVANAELADAPQRIDLWFSEPLEAQFSRLRLLDVHGQEVESGAVLFDPADPTHMALPLQGLAPGVYTVAWHTLSRADGHEWSGFFPFTLLNPDDSRPVDALSAGTGVAQGELPTPMAVIARWLSLFGLLVLGGSISFRWLVAGPIFTQTNRIADQVRASVVEGLQIGALVLVLGGWLQGVVQAQALGGLDRLPTLLLSTRVGQFLLLRCLLAGALWLLLLSTEVVQPALRRRRWLVSTLQLYVLLCGLPILLVTLRQPVGHFMWGAAALLTLAGVSMLGYVRRRGGGWSPVVWWGLLCMAAPTLATFSLVSHATAVSDPTWAVLTDMVHLGVAAVWLGGLLLLARLLWRLRGQLGAHEALTLFAVARRYSRLAAASILILTATGLYSSFVQLPQLSALWTSTYGRLLLIKLALIALALGVAWFNNRMVHGRRATQLPQLASGRFLRQVMGESALGLGILVAVALLVQAPVPQAVGHPSAGADRTFEQIVMAGDLHMHLQIAPDAEHGSRFQVHLYRLDGMPIGEVQLVRLIFDHPEAGRAQLDLAPLAGESFAAAGPYLTQAGTWKLSIYVRRRGLDDLQTTVEVAVPAAAGDSVP